MPETRGTIRRFNNTGYEVVVDTTRLRCTSTLWANIKRHFKVGNNVLAAWEMEEDTRILKALVKQEEKEQ